MLSSLLALSRGNKDVGITDASSHIKETAERQAWESTVMAPVINEHMREVIHPCKSLLCNDDTSLSTNVDIVHRDTANASPSTRVST